MVKLSLKGQFKFNGNGKFSEERRKIKVLKQLGNELFICGDRATPELIYSIPLSKKITYAHIDNQGETLENWVVTVFLKPASAVLDEEIDYNQQSSIEGDEEVVYIDKDGVIKSFSLLAPTKVFNNNKIHTGNNNCYQLLDYDDEHTVFRNNDDVQRDIISRFSNQINLFNRYSIGNLLTILKKATISDSTAQERRFYLDPYHKIKGVYCSHLIETSSQYIRYSFRGIEAQTYHVEEARSYTTRKIESPPSSSGGTDGREGNRDSDGMQNFLDECGEPGDIIVFLFALDPGWEAGSISYIRAYPNMCQGKAPPNPTFQASCSAVPFPEGERRWCPAFVGSGYYAPFKIDNFEFVGTPPFGGEVYEAPGSKYGYAGRFVPDPKTLSSGKLTEIGDSVTTVAGRGDLRAVGVMRNRVVLEGDDIGTVVTEPNPAVDQYLNNTWSGRVLLDMKVFGPRVYLSEREYERKIKSSCTRPNPPPDQDDGDEDGRGPRYFPGDVENKRDPSKLYEYYKDRYFIGEFGYREYFIIKLTDKDNAPINEEIRNLFLSPHGFSCNPETKLFFHILPLQKALNEDILLTKENITEWDIEEYSFEIFNSNSITENSESSYSKRLLKEEVLPLKSFDKIWSYSYYSLEENA